MTTSAQSQLEEALARVAALEREIAERERGPRRRNYLATYLALVACVFMVGAIAGALMVPPVPKTIIGKPQPPRPPPAAGELTWGKRGLFSNEGPLLVDVNGDGQKDIIAPAWHETREDEPAFIVAIDRKTKSVLWRGGPFKAQARDERLQVDYLVDHVVVADATREKTYLFARTGARDEEMAPFGNVATKSGARPPCPDALGAPCIRKSDEAVEALLQGALHYPHVFATELIAPGDTLTIAHALSESDSRDFIVRFDGSGTRVLWSTPLIPAHRRVDPYPRMSPNDWTTLAGGRIFSVYQIDKGPYFLAARDSHEGTLLYDVPLASFVQGSFIEWVSADADEVFVVGDGALFILDAKTGAVTHRIRDL